MTKPTLTYFDIPASRGEECRLALFLSGIEFEDKRIKGTDWPALKPTTPYGSMPILELPGKPPLAHSNAILALIGRRHGLHPSDDFEAARHEAMMVSVEEVRHTVGPTLRLSDPTEKQAKREDIAANYLPSWAKFAEKHIEGPFFAGAKLHVVDLKLFMIVRWFALGTVDHIPATVFDPFPKLTGVYKAVGGDGRVRAWFAR
ncbi:MAG: glutathione S-transferase family protein [Deltaproteobacteria bacterium]|nr:glutathione S-transferase family protein [Deltaproteobacteria bacterium]